MSECRKMAAAPPTIAPCKAHAIGIRRRVRVANPYTESSRSLADAASPSGPPEALYGLPPAQKTLPADCKARARTTLTCLLR